MPDRARPISAGGSFNVDTSPKKVGGDQDALLELLKLLIPAEVEVDATGDRDPPEGENAIPRLPDGRFEGCKHSRSPPEVRGA